MRRARFLAGIAVALASCAARGEPPIEPAPAPLTAAALDPRHDPAFRVAASRAGTFTAAWRAPRGIKKNEYLELEVFLYEGEQPLAGAQLAVSGWMPEHGHGFVVFPRVKEAGGGRYLVEGVLLHMRGTWQLLLDVERGGYSERVEFELEL